MQEAIVLCVIVKTTVGIEVAYSTKPAVLIVFIPVRSDVIPYLKGGKWILLHHSLDCALGEILRRV